MLLGMTLDQQNVLLRLVLRAIDRSLTHAECNELRDAAKAAKETAPASGIMTRPCKVLFAPNNRRPRNITFRSSGRRSAPGGASHIQRT